MTLFPQLAHDPRYPLSHVRVIDEPSVTFIEGRREIVLRRDPRIPPTNDYHAVIDTFNSVEVSILNYKNVISG